MDEREWGIDEDAAAAITLLDIREGRIDDTRPAMMLIAVVVAVLLRGLAVMLMKLLLTVNFDDAIIGCPGNCGPSRSRDCSRRCSGGEERGKQGGRRSQKFGSRQFKAHDQTP